MELLRIRILLGILLFFFILWSFFVDFNNYSNSIEITGLLFFFVTWSAISSRIEGRDKRTQNLSVDQVDPDRRKFLYFSVVTVVALLVGAKLPYVDVQSQNLLNNGDFTNGTSGWYLPPGIFTWRISPDVMYNGYPVLEVETDATDTYGLLWSWISSDLIRVDYGSKYKIITHMRGENVLGAGIVVQPYDENRKQLNYQLIQVPSGRNGNFPFDEYETTVIMPYGIHYIGIYLNASLAMDAGKFGKTYFAELSVTKVSSLIG